MSSSEVDSRSITISMRKSVENLVISSQDAIGQSISQALNFSGVISQHATQIIQETRREISAPLCLRCALVLEKWREDSKFRLRRHIVNLSNFSHSHFIFGRVLALNWAYAAGDQGGEIYSFIQVSVEKRSIVISAIFFTSRGVLFKAQNSAKINISSRETLFHHGSHTFKQFG
ncbi:hypothetical protein evm_004560 [Chilo suppressalis]|nr:hypothetical protein evm_004560 [Chilo suppressalis]